MRPDGSGRRRLSRVYGDYPAWSPDGRKIAFDHIAFGSGSTDWDIWVMNAAGSGARPLIASGASEPGPAWSPDGRTIAYQSEPIRPLEGPQQGAAAADVAHIDEESRRRVSVEPERDGEKDGEDAG